jgi:ABC-type glutathione transport system ATPase component
VAAILAARPDFLIFDEPSSALGVQTLLKATNAAFRALCYTPQAMIFVSHNLTLLTSTCDRIVGLAFGRVRFDETTDELLSDERHLAIAALELTPVLALSNRLADLGFSRRTSSVEDFLLQYRLMLPGNDKD